MCTPCAVIILCCGAVGSAARALAEAFPAIGPSANALASSNEELKEAFMLMYDHGTISAADMALVNALGDETGAFAAEIDAKRWEWSDGDDEDEDVRAFAQRCDDLRWKGLNLFTEISKRTSEYAGPKKQKK